MTETNGDKGKLASSNDDDVVLGLERLLSSDVFSAELGYDILEVYKERFLRSALRDLED